MAVLVSVDISASQPKSSPAAASWPLGLGTLESVPQRFPPRKMNAAAARLTLLAARIGFDFKTSEFSDGSAVDRRILRFLEAQVGRSDNRVDPLPVGVDAYFKKNETHLNAVRDLLVSGPVEWRLDLKDERASMPNFRAHTLLSRVLVARALAQSSWNDLRAAAALGRSLSSRPELTSQIVSLAITRLILASARKMPPPVPAWAKELTEVDPRPGVIAAMQAETWWVQQEMLSEGDGGSAFDRLEDIVLKPFDQMFASEYYERMRLGATEMSASRQCAFDAGDFNRRMRSNVSFWNRVARDRLPNLGSLWQRIARLTAERELTAIVLQIESGQRPQLKSSCSDGSWRISRDAAGTQVRFSRRIPVRPPSIEIPLEQTIK